MGKCSGPLRLGRPRGILAMVLGEVLNKMRASQLSPGHPDGHVMERVLGVAGLEVLLFEHLLDGRHHKAIWRLDVSRIPGEGL